MPDAKLIRAWPLTGGISARMTAFEVGTGRIYTLRQVSDPRIARNPLAATHEFWLLGQLVAAGLKVPRPIHLDEVAHQYVSEYLAGAPDLSPANLHDHLRQYAHQLAQIHAVDHARPELAFLPRQKPKELARPETMNLELREDEIRTALERRGPVAGSNPPVLRHGDYWPGNVLWSDREITGVIDWEECLVGEPLADLAVARLDVLWVHGEDAMRTFTELYQARMNLELADLPYWDLLAALRPINYIPTMAPAYPQLGRPDITVETMNDRLRLFAEQALVAM